MIRLNVLAAVLLINTPGLGQVFSPQPSPSTHGDAAPSDRSEQLSFQPRDRVLFVGDELTQQMFYTRAVASALMAVMPESDLRFFNGGFEGATSDDALTWLDDLMDLTGPNVVFLCFGLNDYPKRAHPQTVIDDYARNLTALVAKARGYPSVRGVIIVGPPPVQIGLTEEPEVSGPNRLLRDMSQAAEQVSRDHNTGFIPLFDYMKRVFLGAALVGGEPLTLGGRLPTEPAHTVIASVILRGIGIRPEQLEPLGWSPLPPLDMGRIRPVLALELSPPNLEAAQCSRDLYESMRRFDEIFFRLWRLSRRNSASGQTDQTLQATADQAWSVTNKLARQYYGKNPTGP